MIRLLNNPALTGFVSLGFVLSEAKRSQCFCFHHSSALTILFSRDDFPFLYSWSLAYRHQSLSFNPLFLYLCQIHFLLLYPDKFLKPSSAPLCKGQADLPEEAYALYFPFCNRMIHEIITALIINMVFLSGINVLNMLFVIYQGWDCPYKAFAGIKHIKERMTVLVKCQAVMILHLSCNPVVIPRFPIHSLFCHNIRNGFSPVRCEYRRIGNPCDLPAFQIFVCFSTSRIILACSAGSSFRPTFRLTLLAPIQFPDPVYTPFIIHRIPPYRKWFCVTKIIAAAYRSTPQES